MTFRQAGMYVNFHTPDDFFRLLSFFVETLSKSLCTLFEEVAVEGKRYCGWLHTLICRWFLKWIYFWPQSFLLLTFRHWDLSALISQRVVAPRRLTRPALIVCGSVPHVHVRASPGMWDCVTKPSAPPLGLVPSTQLQQANYNRQSLLSPHALLFFFFYPEAPLCPCLPPPTPLRPRLARARRCRW